MTSLSGKTTDESGIEIFSPEALEILDKLTVSEKRIVLQSIVNSVQNIHLHDSSEIVMILERDPELAKMLILAAIKDGEIEREHECKFIDSDIEARRVSLIQQGWSLACTWLVVIISMIGSLIGYYFTQSLGWILLALVFVGGPAAVQIIARNTSINVNSTNQLSPLDENSK